MFRHSSVVNACHADREEVSAMQRMATEMIRQSVDSVYFRIVARQVQHNKCTRIDVSKGAENQVLRTQSKRQHHLIPAC